MSQHDIRTSDHTDGFFEDVHTQLRWGDLLLIATVPVILVGIYFLPRSTLEGLVFDTTAPSLLTAYTSHFVQLDGFHLLGNVTVYVPVVGMAYLLCILSDRRQLFRITFLTLVFVFPVALSAMQVIFPRERLIFGFSGINAGFVGLACFALTGYLGKNISERADDRYAPSLFFFAVGLIALIGLPARAFRLEIGASSLALSVLYLGIGLYQQGPPSKAEVKAAIDRPGYFETAGAGFGLLAGYPFVAFQDAVVPDSGVLDVYVHILGFALAFIIVFIYVSVIRNEKQSAANQASDGTEATPE